MYVRTCVRMYVCMYAVSLSACLSGRMFVWLSEMHVVYLCMYVCMYVCLYGYVPSVFLNVTRYVCVHASVCPRVRA